jgi:NAD-dependent DNA ligase
MNIDGLGDVIIDQLVSEGHVKSYADLFGLKSEQIAQLTRDTPIGSKKAGQIVKSIDAARLHAQAWLDKAIANDPSNRDVVGQLEWLADKARMNLRSLGRKTIELLHREQLLKQPADLLALTVDRIAPLTQPVQVGEKTACKIIEEIEKAKGRGLGRVLGSISIRLIGMTNAREFASWAGSIERLLSASVDDLVRVISKDATSQADIEAKERVHTERLYRAIHPESAEGLFDAPQPTTSWNEYTETRDGLQAYDEIQPHKSKLKKGRIEKLAECFPTMPELESASLAELLDCLISGRAVARSLYDFLHSEWGKETIEGLRKAGVMLSQEAVQTQASEWTGKTVVITGSFEGFTRDEIKARLMMLGAKVGSVVSSKTDALFVGEDAGSKLAEAKKHGVPTYAMDAVKEMMGRKST